MKKWYVVYEGSVPGVYEHWEDCFKKVNKFKGNNYKSYKSKRGSSVHELPARAREEEPPDEVQLHLDPLLAHRLYHSLVCDCSY